MSYFRHFDNNGEYFEIELNMIHATVILIQQLLKEISNWLKIFNCFFKKNPYFITLLQQEKKEQDIKINVNHL